MTKQLLTHSRMQSFRQCRKKHWWEYEVGLRKETDAKALRMGSAGHDALDLLKMGKPLEEALEMARSHYEPMPDGMDEYEWSIERETVECLVTAYHWRWSNSRLTLLESEHSFRVPLINPQTNATSYLWDLAGKIDGIVQLEDGRLAILEHKFISDSLEVDSDYWRRLQLDPQVSIYMYAARQLGFDVETVLYDVIRKPTIRTERVPLVDEDGYKIVLDNEGNRAMTKTGKPRQTGSSKDGLTLQTRPMTPEEWGEKLLHDISERHEFYFARREIARLDTDIIEMLEEVWDLQKTLRDAQGKDRWYKTVSRDTCTFCAFFGLCTAKFDGASGEIPEGFIKLQTPHPELEDQL